MKPCYVANRSSLVALIRALSKSHLKIVEEFALTRPKLKQALHPYDLDPCHQTLIKWQIRSPKRYTTFHLKGLKSAHCDTVALAIKITNPMHLFISRSHFDCISTRLMLHDARNLVYAYNARRLHPSTIQLNNNCLIQCQTVDVGAFHKIYKTYRVCRITISSRCAFSSGLRVSLSNYNDHSIALHETITSLPNRDRKPYASMKIDQSEDFQSDFPLLLRYLMNRFSNGEIFHLTPNSISSCHLHLKLQTFATIQMLHFELLLTLVGALVAPALALPMGHGKHISQNSISSPIHSLIPRY